MANTTSCQRHPPRSQLVHTVNMLHVGAIPQQNSLPLQLFPRSTIPIGSQPLGQGTAEQEGSRHREPRINPKVHPKVHDAVKECLEKVPNVNIELIQKNCKDRIPLREIQLSKGGCYDYMYFGRCNNKSCTYSHSKQPVESRVGPALEAFRPYLAGTIQKLAGGNKRKAGE